jgi:ribosomal protein L11 methyltransferase
MKMTELVFDHPSPGSSEAEILMAMLYELGAEGVNENENDFSVFWNEEEFVKFQDEINKLTVACSFRKIMHSARNWNSEWEKNYPMVVIDNRIAIHAPFHTDIPSLPYKILINPGMAFGTGHHSTTSLMLRLMFSVPVPGSEVIDMGCGSGVLAIMASLLGASVVTAIDNDHNSVENTRLNISANHIRNITCLEGDAALLNGRKCGILLANITRNILLNDFEAFHHCLIPGGYLLLSGFISDDLILLSRKASEYGMEEKNVLYEKEWVAAAFYKPEKISL